MNSIDKAEGGSIGSRQPPRFFFAALFLVFVVLALFINQIPGLYSYQKDGLSDLSLGFFSFLVVFEFLFAGILSYVGYVFYGKRPNYVLLVILVILIISLAIGIFATPSIDPPYTDILYTFSVKEKTISWLAGTGSLLGVYMVVYYGRLLKFSRSSMTFILELFVIYAITGIVYSIVNEWSLYESAFSQGKYLFAVEARSFVHNKNVFPTSIFIAIMAELLMIHYSKNLFRWIPVLLFSYFISLYQCKTVITLLPILLPCFFLIQVLSNRKKRNAYFWLNLAALIVVILFESLALADPLDFLDALRIFDDFVTIASRRQIWESALSLFVKYPLNLILGFGDHIFSIVLVKGTDHPLDAYGYSHNAFIETIGTGGILRLAVYLLLLIWMCVTVLKNIMKKRSDAWVHLLFFVSVIARSMIENEAFFNFNYESMAFLVIILIPLFSEDSMKRSTAQVYQPTAGHPSCLLLISVLILALLPIVACCLGTVWALVLLLAHGAILVALGIKEGACRLPLTILSLDTIGFALAYNIGSDSVTILGFSVAWAILIIMLFWGYSIKKGYKLTCRLETAYSSLIAKMDQKIPD